MRERRIRSRTVPLFLGRLEEAARNKLCRKLGIALPAGSTKDPAPLLPLSVVRQIAEEVARLVGEPELGVLLAETVPPGLYGWIELMARSAPTPRQGIALLGRYGSILDDGTVVSIDREGESLVFSHFLPREPEAFGRQVNELMLCYLVRALRETLRQPGWAPRELRFAHPAPRVRRRMQAFVGTDHILYDQGRNALVFEPEVLDLPSWTRAPDAGLMTMLEQGAQRLIAAGPRDFWTKLQQEIDVQLRRGSCTVVCVARAMELSSRTLQRRLTAEQLTFSAVVEQTRRSLAEEALADGAVSTAELAERLGYRNPQAFSRAFKRWTGAAPRAYRRRRGG